MNRQEQLLELENEIAKANKEIGDLKSGMTPGQMISVIFLFISIFMIFIRHCTHKMRHKKTLLLKSGKIETGVFCYGQKSIFSRN